MRKEGKEMWWLSLIPMIGTGLFALVLHHRERTEDRREINQMADRDRKRQRREPPHDFRRMRYATIGGKVKSVRL
jgi:hypothetical protein